MRELPCRVPRARHNKEVIKMNENLDRMIGILCREREERVPPLTEEQKPDFFRALCNVRPPMPVSEEFLRLQDEYLSARTRERGIVEATALPYRNKIALWRGDITRLNADAIVNACNSALLGCFHPLHNCIDNIIHSCAGVQVRLDCNAIMQGREEPNGSVQVTKAYNLPSKYIFHTVGPIVYGGVTKQNRQDLANCYSACLRRAHEMGLHTIAFCCISTGEYRFPPKEAAGIAVHTVGQYLAAHEDAPNVIFNVFQERDYEIYRAILRTD